MDTTEITRTLAGEPGFCGVFARDRLPKKTKRPAGLVINTDKASEPGTHWVAYYIGADGRAEYFDPLGDPIPDNEILSFVKRNNKAWQLTVQNLIPYQSTVSSKCGQFCIFFLRHRLNGRSICQISASLSLNPDVNESIVS